MYSSIDRKPIQLWVQQCNSSCLHPAGTTIWTVAFYWIVGSIYIFMDFLNYPRWTRKYKIQPGTNEPVDTNKLLTVGYNIQARVNKARAYLNNFFFLACFLLMQAIGNVLFNQIILGIPITMLCFWIAPNPAIYTLPSINRVNTRFLSDSSCIRLHHLIARLT